MNFNKGILGVNLIKILYIHDKIKYKSLNIYKHLYDFDVNYIPLITSFLGLKLYSNNFKVYRYLNNTAYLNIKNNTINNYRNDGLFNKNNIMLFDQNLFYHNESLLLTDNGCCDNKIVNYYHINNLTSTNIFNIGTKVCSDTTIHEFNWIYNNNIQFRLNLLDNNQCYFQIIVRSNNEKPMTNYLKSEINKFIVIVDKLISYLNINND